MTAPAIPHPASTVVLVRPGADGGAEIFMNRRPEKMETYAGAYVFPGGRVEETDWSKKMLDLVRGLSPADAQQILGADSAAEYCLGYWVAAARELFEEAGILLFVEADGAASLTVEGKSADRLAEQRQNLQRGTLDFSSLLESERASSPPISPKGHHAGAEALRQLIALIPEGERAQYTLPMNLLWRLLQVS